MNGTSVVASGGLGNPGPSWHAIGTGDFNRDGQSDILWQNDSGEVVVWELNGTSLAGAGGLGNPGPNWRVVGTGDIVADGTSNTILFQETGGQAVAWPFNGTSPIVELGVNGNPGPSWHLQGDSSPYRAGSVDLPWQTDTNVVFFQQDSGKALVWATNGTALTGGKNLGNPGPTWHEKAVGDFNADGGSDIVWQNDDGTVVIWETNGADVIASAALGNPGPSWHIASVGDFNGDGRSDILWQNSSGQAVVWLLNGLNVIGSGGLGNPGPVGTSRAAATSTRTAAPTSCGRTTMARWWSGGSTARP